MSISGNMRELAERSIEYLSLETIGSHSSYPVNYIWAPKCGCSSIESTLLRVDGNAHQSFQADFCSAEIDIDKPFSASREIPTIGSSQPIMTRSQISAGIISFG